MQNRFGFKDFVILAVVFVVGLLVALQMTQTDRAWARIGDIQAKMAEIEKQVASGGNSDLLREISDLKTAIATRPININLGGVSGADVSVGSGSPDGGGMPAAVGSDRRDESWARPGVAIAWQDGPAFTNNPESVPGFSEGGEFTEIFGARMPRITPYLSGDVYSRRILDQVVEPLGA